MHWSHASKPKQFWVSSKAQSLASFQNSSDCSAKLKHPRKEKDRERKFVIWRTYWKLITAKQARGCFVTQWQRKEALQWYFLQWYFGSCESQLVRDLWAGLVIWWRLIINACSQVAGSNSSVFCSYKRAHARQIDTLVWVRSYKPKLLSWLKSSKQQLAEDDRKRLREVARYQIGLYTEITSWEKKVQV